MNITELKISPTDKNVKKARNKRERYTDIRDEMKKIDVCVITTSWTSIKLNFYLKIHSLSLRIVFFQ